MRGALLGALVFEGEAEDVDQAEALLASGAVEIEPCHDHRCVGAMAGIVEPADAAWSWSARARAERSAR